MITKITEGVKISVETFYQEEYSQPLNNEFMFAYRITIENGSEHTVKLLRRHWYIFDSCGVTREVEGEGVVGLQPIIEPGKSHQYVSGSHLKTEIGRMHGIYLMERLIDSRQFHVNIPEFQLVAPFKLN
ncbi:MAG: Co2+/Mg2+ efflux protein ApaG [Chitinophagales bacterium]